MIFSCMKKSGTEPAPSPRPQSQYGIRNESAAAFHLCLDAPVAPLAYICTASYSCSLHL